jgi:type VIII secretion system (T8SS) CsgF protein
VSEEQVPGGLPNREAGYVGDPQAGYPQTAWRGRDAKEAFGALGKIVAIFMASGTLLLSTIGVASATDQFTVLRSPSFGGTNAAPFQYEQFDKTLRADRAAAAAKAAASGSATAATDPNQQFADAIISQLNSLVAREIALKIANSQPGDAGTIQSGSVSITFINSDGQLNVVITTPSGSTNLSVPTGD